MIPLLPLLSLLALAAADSSKNDFGISSRILGGTTTDISKFSYQVSLLKNRRHVCGGAIISPTLVVTAAHCVNSYSKFSVRAGSSSSKSGGQVIPASRIIKHENYDRYTTDYDIALIQLASPITIRNAKPISLVPSGTGPPAGAIATITGWGALSEDGISSTQLQVVQVPIVHQDRCFDAYEPKYTITDRMFCAGVVDIGGKDSCQGDSGGPLVIEGELAGVVSWGVGCGDPDYPGVYTNLYVLRSWIDNTIFRYL